MMRRLFLILVVSAVCFTSRSAVEVAFEGEGYPSVVDTPAAASGLNALYTVYDISEVSYIEISGFSALSDVKVQVYSNLGGGYSTERSFTISDGKIRIDQPRGNLGYIVDAGSERYMFWVVDYATSPLKLNSVSSSEETDCDYTRLNVDGSGEELKYYGINGRQFVLSREIKAEYTTLEWDEQQKLYRSENKTSVFDHLSSVLTITPPLYCNSTVTVTGDRFLEAWNLAQSVESGVIRANGLEVHTEAVQTNLSDGEDASNMIKGDDTLLGGSAPADFTFYAYTTDAVIHNEWQIADDPDFEYVRYRFNEQDLDYTFREEGKYYIRFIGSNEDGSCETVGETYEVGIGASDLRIPNAFSPDGDGVNDIWKVGYRSLLEFKCWIFDRNGRKLYYFDDPSGGWDGQAHGKTVSPGVYFYVIEAVGADGVKYKKGGDINIIRYKKIGNSTSGN